MSDSPNTQMQEAVQRLIGRCILQVQEYERAMKAILVQHMQAGTEEALETQRAARAAKFAEMPLGGLVNALFETYIVPEGNDGALTVDDDAPTDRVSISIRHGLVMEPQQLDQTRAAIKEMVAMRNELVHCLIDKFDLSNESGCAAAIEHLEHCRDRIEVHHRELMAWTHVIEAMNASFAQFVQTETFNDLVVHGIAHDGSFNWPSAGIVRVLKLAAKELAEDGWTRLEQAQAWIAADYPKHVPVKYGCRTWRQVLSESRLFDLQYRVGEDGQKVAWFRPRPSV